VTTLEDAFSLFRKWGGENGEERASLYCSGKLQEFTFEVGCRVSAFNGASVTLSSEHGDFSLSLRLDSVGMIFEYREPREYGEIFGQSLTSEQRRASMLVVILHPGSFPSGASTARDMLLVWEIVD
jgi:hypothetical protein